MADRRRSAAVVAALLALMASACSGPNAPLNISAREVPSDIKIGGDADEAGAGTPLPSGDLNAVAPVGSSGSIPSGGESYDLTPPPVVTPSRGPVTAPAAVDFGSGPDQGDSGFPPDRSGAPPPPPPASSCPEPAEGSAPHPAATSIEDPPWPAIYSYRNEGRYQIGGPNSSQGSFPDETSREVRRIRVAHPTGTKPGQDSYLFDVTAVLGDTTTVTTYLLVPEAAADPDSRVRSGLYIDQVYTSKLGTSARNFDPQPNLLLVPTPIVRGFSWSTAGADSRTGEVMAFRGTVQGQTVDVNGCGTWLEAFRIHIDGSFGPGTDDSGGVDVHEDSSSTFVADYDFATAYGPLAVQEDVDVTSFEEGATSHRTNRSTINQEPYSPCDVVTDEQGGRCRPAGRSG